MSEKTQTTQSREAVESAIERSKNGRSTTWDCAVKIAPKGGYQWDSHQEPERKRAMTTKKVGGWYILRDGEVYTFRRLKRDALRDMQGFDLNGFSKHEWSIVKGYSNV